MLTLLEVYQPTEDPEKLIVLARLDLTENTEAERQEALDNVKILYPGCSYCQHICGHDEDKPCSAVEV